MKSIFKKIAFVLAIAMVITMLPAKAASAASDGPDMYKTLLLYLDSGNGEGADITGTYKNERYASVWGWRENGYTDVEFESADPSIATVNSKGKVTAVKVGTTTVTATFTADDMDTVTKTCKVTVKRNAAKVGLGAESAKQVEAGTIKVGDKVQLTAVRKDADGKTEWNKTMKEYTTDSVRFSSSNEEIFKVTKTTGMLTAISAGEATLKVWTVQSEGKDAETGEYPEVVSKEYKVVIAENKVDVQQSASNAFTITFPDEASAKAAVDATLPSLTHADAAVSEDKNVVKAYEVLHAATDKSEAAEQEIFISGISNNGNVVTVTLFNELKEETTYTVRYQDYVEHFVTCKNVAYRLGYDVASGVPNETSVEKTILYRLYAQGKNGQDVDITFSKAYGGEEAPWRVSVKLEDLAKDYDPKYVVNGNTIWFYTLDQNFEVKLLATFEDWYVVNGNAANILTCDVRVTPGNTSITAGNIVEWGIVKLKEGDAYTNKKVAVEDEKYRLAIKASINKYGTPDTVHTNLDDLENDKFTFISSNDDKLSVDKYTGEIYPPKSAVSNVLVHVYYDGSWIGSCPVTVVAKRAFTTLSVNTNGKTKLAAGENFLDTLWFKVEALDQLGTVFDGDDYGSMDINVTVSDNENKGKYVELGSWWAPAGSGHDLDVLNSGHYAGGICVTWDAPEKATPIRVIVTATYTPFDGNEKGKITRKYSFNFNVKNTRGGVAKTYKLETSTNSIDEALYVPGKFNLEAEQDSDKGTIVSNMVAEVSAFSVDKEGYKIRQLDLSGIGDEQFGSNSALGKDQAMLLIKRGTETIKTEGLENELGFKVEKKNGNDILKFTAVSTVSGSAIKFKGTPIGDTIVVSGSAIDKIERGNYIVNLFIGNNEGKADFKASQVISVIDNQDVPAFKWVKNEVEEGSNIYIATQALKLHFDADRNNNSGKDVTENIIWADIQRVGNRRAIGSVYYEWTTPEGYKYIFKVAVNRPTFVEE